MLSRRRRPTRGRVAVTLAVALACGGSLPVLVDPASSAPTPPAQAAVTVSGAAGLTAVPRSFFGISTEYWSLPLYGSRMPIFARVLRMLAVPGDGRMILRIGGDSADHAFWDLRVRRPPRWAFDLTPRWVELARRLTQRDHVRLILDLNLVTDSPQTAARWARAALDRLPRGSVAGFEIGNEPDIYSRRYWLGMTGGRLISDRALPTTVTPVDYVTDFRAYEAALDLVAPTVPLLGPATANPRAHAQWVAAFLASHPSDLGIVSVHRYPYSACVPRRSPTFPTIARLLSRKATAGMAASLAHVIHLAQAARLPLRVTELNSVTCSGRRGVSNTFATALWAPEALMYLVRAGVVGVNVHIRADAINSPFTIGAHGLTARPLLYGLILFVRTLGPGAELAGVHVRTVRSAPLSAWAVRLSSGSLHVLMINDGRRPVRVSLRLPTTGPAWIQRLTAPSVHSQSGVTLDGQWLGPAGTWVNRPSEALARPSRRGYRLVVPPRSAALLGATLMRGALSDAPAVRWGPSRRPDREGVRV